MASTVEELTIEYKEGDLVSVKELDKEILSKGAWATILYKYQDWDRTKEVYGPIKFSIRRYQKKGGVYQLKSKFAISSVDQAQKIINKLNEWMGK